MGEKNKIGIKDIILIIDLISNVAIVWYVAFRSLQDISAFVSMSGIILYLLWAAVISLIVGLMEVIYLINLCRKKEARGIIMADKYGIFWFGLKIVCVVVSVSFRLLGII